MNRLIINPNRPDSWEIQLKEGANRLGRSDDADFKIADGSVSSSHCTFLVANGDVTIQDLGSTNGTFINGRSIQTAKLS
ncbi:MAG TPA: FHA domain-containing protein, partial [Candidatus Binatia bacterium]|nr:FHA domain-containing protein [Candidatus Binatia bacterium]